MSHEPTTVPPWSDLLHDPDDNGLAELTAALWEALVDFGVPLWALPASVGGQASERMRVLQRYARVAEGSLTAAFILSQHDAAVRRLAAAADRHSAHSWLAMIKADEAFAT